MDDTILTQDGANGSIGAVRTADIVNEMQGAYLDYAMSVIVARALPDVRDGLKPVHRRILYAMHHDLGLDHTKPHKKSARIVGEVLGKYHPHGDTAVYDAMVRMAQEFSLRYPLIDGQGNFGSVDGDNAAAMRYTEARLAEISDLMLADLEKDTVDWGENFDNSLREPNVLPAALPNLLINGSSGIAVGMATNVPSHNLGEVVDALAYMLDHYERMDDITVEHLMQFVKGPDFPTGGILYRYRDEGKDDESVDAIAQGYSVGRARLVVQAKAHFEEMSRGRSRIVITELPYQTNKVALLERIASLVRDGKLEGITDLRDESDRTGMRVSIELTRNVEPKDILADLFKLTPLQQTFGMQMLALVNGEPRMLSLKRMLQLFIEHRREIIRRRSEYDLRRARERAHILEGLLRALDILDEVIATIRRSRTVETARNNLIHDFGFTQIQAQAILDMQLRRLAALERRKLQDEHKEIQKQIAYLEDLLANPAKLLGVIKADLLAIKEKYGDARRTQIVDRTKGTLTSTDLLPDQAAWVSVSAGGELRRHDRTRLSDAVLREIGKGSEVELLPANTRDFLYLFGKDGQCRRVSIHEIPPFGQARRLAELTEFTRRDEVTAAIALPRVEPSAAKGYLFLVTEQGMVKRVMLSDLLSAAASDPLVINVDAKDRLRWVLHTQGGQEVILVSASGQSIRFSEEDVRSMGLAAGGVGGMRLKRGDRVVSAHVVDPGGELVTITELGYAKRTALDQYSSQGRNGGGIVTHKVSSRTGNVVAAYLLPAQGVESLIVLQEKGGVKLVESEAIPQMGRGVMGKQATAAMAGNRVTAVKAAAAALTADDIAAGVVEQTVAPPAPAPVPATDGGDGDPPTAAPKPSSRAKSGAASAKPPASKPAPAAKTRPPARSKRIVETQPELPLKAEAAQPASKSNGADGQGKPPVEVKQPSQPKSRRARSTGDAQAAKPSGKTAEAGGKPAAPSQRTVKAETAAETTAAPPKQRKAEGATGSQTKQPQKPKAPAQRSKATQPSSRARASGEAAAEPAKPAKAAPSEPSKPAKEKPAAPAARAKKPARKSGKLSTVTTVKKPRAKK